MLILFAMIQNNTATLNPRPFATVGSKAPNFALRNAKGQIIQLKSFRGQPVLLNFWASWCIPCQSELPTIQHLYQSEGKRFTVLTVNLTAQEKNIQAPLTFLHQNHYTFPTLFDTQNKVASAYFVREYPTTFFIDPQGVIRAVVLGAETKNAMLRHLKEAKL